ncbi:MAG: hypothetical protein CJBNEKGG_03222 [Prosthecobacter sp.]|nr:hypothetical protein [Prosthecobacter sp.]
MMKLVPDMNPIYPEVRHHGAQKIKGSNVLPWEELLSLAWWLCHEKIVQYATACRHRC